MKRTLFGLSYIPGIEDIESYKYTFNTASDCGIYTFYIGLCTFLMSEVLLDFRLIEQLTLLLIVLLFGIWIPFFRIFYFYTDRMVVFFPFRPGKRAISIFYTDIQYFKWSKTDMAQDRLRPILEVGSKWEKWRARIFYSIPIQYKKKFYFLLKFLYDRDCPTTHKKDSDSEDGVFARRINYLFGFAETRPSRPYHTTPAEAKIEREAGIFIVAICIILSVLFVLLITYLERR